MPSNAAPTSSKRDLFFEFVLLRQVQPEPRRSYSHRPRRRKSDPPRPGKQSTPGSRRAEPQRSASQARQPRRPESGAQEARRSISPARKPQNTQRSSSEAPNRPPPPPPPSSLPSPPPITSPVPSSPPPPYSSSPEPQRSDSIKRGRGESPSRQSLSRGLSGLSRSLSRKGTTRKTKKHVSFAVEKDEKSCNTAAKQLPQGVLDCIAYHLKRLHVDCNGVCDTCLLRDLVSCTKTCRSWCTAMAPNIYSNIRITGADSWATNRRSNSKYGGRLIELKRTLSTKPEYAALVKELTIAEPDRNFLGKSDLRKAQELIAAVVRECPNLEKLHGVTISSYNYNSVATKDPIHLALASRTRLREHFWCLEAPDRIEMKHIDAFSRCNENWENLEILVLQGCSGGGRGGLNHLAFWGLFNCLPALKRLAVSRFYEWEFDSGVLLALPPLEHLHLEELPGLDDAGLMEYARRSSAASLRSMALVDCEIGALSTVTKLFTLRRLTKFTLQQTEPPQPLHADSPNHPLASVTVVFLHWDLLAPGHANASLAQAIQAGHFPALRTLRAPSDHHGILQSVCHPRSSIALPADKEWAKHIASRVTAAAGSQKDPLQGQSRSLPEARLQAELRVRQARNSVFMKMVMTPPPNTPADEPRSEIDPTRLHYGIRARRRIVEYERTSEDPGERYHDWKEWDPDAREERSRKKKTPEKNTVLEFPAFMGDLRSSVYYCLEPDVPGSEEAFARVKDVVLGQTAKEEKLQENAKAAAVVDPAVCDGRWNSRASHLSTQWQHTGRRRRDVGVKTGFDALFDY